MEMAIFLREGEQLPEAIALLCPDNLRFHHALMILYPYIYRLRSDIEETRDCMRIHAP
jgi:hypothetical protein